MVNNGTRLLIYLHNTCTQRLTM